MNLRRSADGTRRSSTPSSKTSTSHESRESSVGRKDASLKNGYKLANNNNKEEVGYVL